MKCKKKKKINQNKSLLACKKYSSEFEICPTKNVRPTFQSTCSYVCKILACTGLPFYVRSLPKRRHQHHPVLIISCWLWIKSVAFTSTPSFWSFFLVHSLQKSLLILPCAENVPLQHIRAITDKLGNLPPTIAFALTTWTDDRHNYERKK
jgi:hypothetical protein